MPASVIDHPSVAGLGALRPPPPGLPAVDQRPPVVAEPDDPFSAARVIALLARVERGRPVRLSDIADRLNAIHLDWLFPVPVVTAVVLQLQANWMADYRSSGGIVVEDGPFGATVAIEDSSRVDPWIVRQVQRQVAAGDERLREFSRREGVTGDG